MRVCQHLTGRNNVENVDCFRKGVRDNKIRQAIKFIGENKSAKGD